MDLLLQKPLSTRDAIAQARLERRILLALLDVRRNRRSDDFRDRAVFDVSNCFQRFCLLFRQPNSHCFGAFHAGNSHLRHLGCQVAWYRGIMQPLRQEEES